MHFSIKSGPFSLRLFYTFAWIFSGCWGSIFKQTPHKTCLGTRIIRNTLLPDFYSFHLFSYSEIENLCWTHRICFIFENARYGRWRHTNASWILSNVRCLNKNAYRFGFWECDGGKACLHIGIHDHTWNRLTITAKLPTRPPAFSHP